MAGHGAPETAVPEAAGLTLGIAATNWNAELVDRMLLRARAAAADAKCAEPVVLRVAGAVELPIAAQALARRFDAVVALGVVIRGGTAHFDYVCKSVTEGLTRVALDESTPVAQGVLTVDNRAGGGPGRLPGFDRGQGLRGGGRRARRRLGPPLSGLTLPVSWGEPPHDTAVLLAFGVSASFHPFNA